MKKKCVEFNKRKSGARAAVSIYLKVGSVYQSHQITARGHEGPLGVLGRRNWDDTPVVLSFSNIIIQHEISNW